MLLCCDVQARLTVLANGVELLLQNAAAAEICMAVNLRLCLDLSYVVIDRHLSFLNRCRVKFVNGNAFLRCGDAAVNQQHRIGVPAVLRRFTPSLCDSHRSSREASTT